MTKNCYLMWITFLETVFWRLKRNCSNCLWWSNGTTRIFMKVKSCSKFIRDVILLNHELVLRPGVKSPVTSTDKSSIVITYIKMCPNKNHNGEFIQILWQVTHEVVPYLISFWPPLVLTSVSILLWRLCSGSSFNIKMTSYRYGKSHCGGKTILCPSYLHNGISYTGKTTSLYWIRALVSTWVSGPVPLLVPAEILLVKQHSGIAPREHWWIDIYATRCSR